jgi:hypothetical protein
MTQQELIEQNVRMLLGDLQLQLIMARARIQELEQAASDSMLDKQNPVPNGRFEEAETRQ